MNQSASFWPACAVFALATGCASEEPAGTEPEVDALVSKSADIKALDAMVDEINGYRSLDDYVVVARKQFPQSLVVDLSHRCSNNDRVVSEAGTKLTVREGSSKRLRQVTRVWSTWTGAGKNTSHTVHESAVYDSSGKLRVLVLDVDSDHLLDEVYMAKLFVENEAVPRRTKALGVLDTTQKKVEVANSADDLQTSGSSAQYRIYLDASGRKVLETVRRGLEYSSVQSSAGQHAAGASPPVLYDEKGIHPSPAKSRFRFSAIFPVAVGYPVELPEVVVRPSESWASRALTKPTDNPEAILKQLPVCK